LPIDQEPRIAKQELLELDGIVRRAGRQLLPLRAHPHYDSPLLPDLNQGKN
jgi:hypothetical protein